MAHRVAAAAAANRIEVVGLVYDHSERSAALQIDSDAKKVRVHTELGFRDFDVDGISTSDNKEFYCKFLKSKVNGVKLGHQFTILMYGAGAGSGKGQMTIGIVSESMVEFLGSEGERNDRLVQVSILEIHNEEVYDCVPAVSKVKLGIMGKKAKNATLISGNEARKILMEIQKVENRRAAKNPLGNESHLMIIVEIPAVGGRLILVDVAGFENIEQASQNELGKKMQKTKVNQGKIALRRVVESIANGDSHVPFRDSKLTMLLQDSFEEVTAKMLMILCISRKPDQLQNNIAALEYGAKARCVVRGPPHKLKVGSHSMPNLGSTPPLDQIFWNLDAINRNVIQHQHEVEVSRYHPEEIEYELCFSRGGSRRSSSLDLQGGSSMEPWQAFNEESGAAAVLEEAHVSPVPIIENSASRMNGGSKRKASEVPSGIGKKAKGQFERKHGSKRKASKVPSGIRRNAKGKFERKWLYEDEIYMLEALMLHEEAQMLHEDSEEPIDFYDFVFRGFSFEPTPMQLRDKLNKTRRKFFERRNQGDLIEFPNEHEKIMYHLSEMIWG